MVLDVQLKCDLAEMEEFELLTSEFDMSRAKKKVSRLNWVGGMMWDKLLILDNSLVNVGESK